MKGSNKSHLILILTFHCNLYLNPNNVNLFSDYWKTAANDFFFFTDSGLMEYQASGFDFYSEFLPSGYFLSTFTLKEFSVSGAILFILILSLWFYRRYEIIKIRNSLKTIVKEPDYPVNNSSDRSLSSVLPVAGRRSFHCLFDLLKNQNENGFADVSSEYRNNNRHKFTGKEKDSFSKELLNKGLFCDFVCMINAKCFFSVNILLQQADSIKSSDKFNYPYHILPFNHSGSSPNNANFSKQAELIYPEQELTATGCTVPALSAYDHAFLIKLGKIIEAKYTDTSFSVEQMAFDLNLSVSQVNRRLKELTDYPAGHLLRVFRMHRAAGLIIAKAGSVSEICFNTGFSSQSYFSRAFKKQFGYSPSVYSRIVMEKSMLMR